MAPAAPTTSQITHTDVCSYSLGVLPNGSRLSCGALKKNDSFP